MLAPRSQPALMALALQSTLICCMRGTIVNAAGYSVVSAPVAQSLQATLNLYTRRTIVSDASSSVTAGSHGSATAIDLDLLRAQDHPQR